MMATKSESPGQKITTRKKIATPKTVSTAPHLTGNGVVDVLESGIDPDVRRQLVAAEAYYLAERRGFAAGNELADWIAAEAVVDSRLQQMRVA